VSLNKNTSDAWIHSWKAASERQSLPDVLALLKMLIKHPPSPDLATPPWIALHLSSPWLVDVLESQGRGPLTWETRDWWGFFNPFDWVELRRKFVNIEEYISAHASKDIAMWKRVGSTMVQRLSPPEWAVCLAACMGAPTAHVFPLWLDRAKAAGLDLRSLVVPSEKDPRYYVSPSSRMLPSKVGTLLRVAWGRENLSFAQDLVRAGVGLHSPEPMVDPAWSAEGWTMAGELIAISNPDHVYHARSKHWKCLWDLARAVEINQALPAPSSSAPRPRF